ncbi:putative mitochondrial protein [Cucumis melo var. makuwa]|uniref:Putative mitochondrial protein n=1 Tax=Cucumis melo var. makuwa TaxID=1194695 RepID=A0A5D3BTQ8_CUCMM|nr:putative mitochondrial protein [Cucumis melo var. makuwa]
MVYFTERFLSRVQHLVVFFDRNQPREDGLSLLVEKPWAGSFADHWVLQSSIHNEAPYSDRVLTLEQCLIEGQTRWGAVTKVPGELCFTNYYWEWLGLVVDRNVRLLYSARLYGVAYYSIVYMERKDRATSSKNDSQVTISSWISFWYLGSRSYDKSTTRKQKKASRFKSTQNPDGSKIQAREWSSRENMLFAELGIRNDLKDETYLAAFLSCWLCLFVFPQKGSFLHPEYLWFPNYPKTERATWGGKEICLVEVMTATLDEEIKEHKDESDSDKSDRHWKIPLKKTKVSGDDPSGRGLIEIGSNESLMGPHVVDSPLRKLMIVGGKDIGCPSSKGDACLKAPLQKVGENVVSNFFKKIALSLEKKELERRLYSINAESEQLSILSCEKAEAIDQQELEVAKLQDEVNTLESTSTISEEAIKALAMVLRSMEAAREEFKNFKWKL